jgi:hypothetical protein
MSWTYEPSLDEYDKEVTQDTSTAGRWTFKRYMYFKPDSYDNWSMGKPANNKNYSFDLITNDNFPQIGDSCPDNVNFYVLAIVSIKNLSSEEHGEHSSYCQVTVEYENKKKTVPSSSGGGGKNPNKSKPPWKRPVDDFMVVSQEMTRPLTYAYNGEKNEMVVPSTSAGQPFYDLTDSYFIQRATWTFATKSGDYSISAPIINKGLEILFEKFSIPAGAGLLLPPGYKKLYWSESGDDDGEEYDEWSFEILIDTTYFHKLNVLNAGTKFLKNNNLVDICSWYTYDPGDSDPPKKQFGSYDEMMAARANVYAKNSSIKDESKKLQWFGDFIQAPIPLTKSGDIDTGSINDPSYTITNTYSLYESGSWNLGVR